MTRAVWLARRERERLARRPTKEHVRDVMAEVDALDLPDGAHWALIHDRLGLEYGEVFSYWNEDPEFFGVKLAEASQ
jgi:hypothetical protein